MFTRAIQVTSDSSSAYQVLACCLCCYITFCGVKKQYSCQNTCLRDQIGTLIAPLIFHQQIKVLNDIIANTNHTNIGKIDDTSCNLCYFYKCVHYISALIILVSLASIFVGK